MGVIDRASIESMQQLMVGWRTLTLDQNAAADVRDLPGMAVRWAESRFSFWNCVTLTDVGIGRARLEAQLSQAAEIMRGKSRTGFLWVFDDALTDDARKVLTLTAEQAGLSFALSATGMAGNVLPIPEPVHPKLTFVRVSATDHLRSYADLNSRAYGFPPEDTRDGFRQSELWTKDMFAYIGFEDGNPVTCAATLPADDRLLVVLVATAPEAQRQGYGEAITRKALYEGWRASGLTRATLHATAAGAPVYRRIGFAPNSPISFYSLR